MLVLGVHRSPKHGVSKTSQRSITLLKGLGVEGGFHVGKLIQHLWRLKYHASRSNLHQVFLIQSELFDDPDFCSKDGIRTQPGQMGKHVTTTGIDHLALSNGTRLHFVNKKHTQAAFGSHDWLVFHESFVPPPQAPRQQPATGGYVHDYG
ncbi:hypothetical protein HO173_012006 [Letharia columbiana]|uniref:Uncharacterized protein n=1 Tax=Letharia columbiana TaxID=112416 RepID=A0A8H6FGW1_9LECA|nr:uncharacterized protein HO173_012006 [Letharia columbiana]KAF6227676.1 hypothetical protein HO173_012006 [Letharia columbiana]